MENEINEQRNEMEEKLEEEIGSTNQGIVKVNEDLEGYHACVGQNATAVCRARVVVWLGR